jgi:hypothetical protein
VGPGRAAAARPAAGERPYLEASYFGGASATLAEQALVLGPGRYRLSVHSKGDRREVSGEVSWRIACLPAKNEIARLRFAGFAEQYRPSTVDFTVPAGCRAQTLTLGGEPGDLAQPVNAQFTQLKVERLG